MPIESIEHADDARLDPYRIVRDPKLVRESPYFIAEGRIVVAELLAAHDWAIEHVLLTPTARKALSANLAARPDVRVFEASNATLKAMAGFGFHQGCLALGVRPAQPSIGDWLGAHGERGPWIVLDAVSNPDNVGAILRSAAGLGAEGAVLTEGSASPLYRKALRSSMGAALRLPWVAVSAQLHEVAQEFSRSSIELVALDPKPPAGTLQNFVQEARTRQVHIAFVVGAEGEGLSRASIDACAARVRIPMAGEQDSLNVAAAAAIALHALRDA